MKITNFTRQNGLKIYTLFIDNKIIAQSKDIDKLKNKLKLIN